MIFLFQSMNLPVDNLLGTFLYAVVFMGVAGLIVGLAFRYIPNRLPYAVKNALMGTTVFLSLFLWWEIIVM